jgi:hypothetical protein
LDGQTIELFGDFSMRKVWIEAAVNGPWSRKFQPDTVETIVAEPASPAEMRRALSGHDQ